jgi:hypothetical protein
MKIRLGILACLLAYLAYSSTKTRRRYVSSERSVNFYQTTRRHISDDNTLHAYSVQASS